MTLPAHRVRAVTVTSILVVIVMLAGLTPALLLAQPVTSNVAPIEETSEVEIDFPRGLIIQADLAWESTGSMAELELLYSVAGNETETLVFVPYEDADPGNSVHADVTIDLQSWFVPAGVAIEYRWRFVEGQEVIAESEPESAMWFDNRWDWQAVESDQVRVHFYDHDDAFVQQILDSAQSTVTELEERYILERSEQLEIWIYPSSKDFQSAQRPNSRDTIAGAAYPDYFLIVAVIPDGNARELRRTIPHEVSHQILFQATDNPFAYPPLWFNEGMATQFQTGGTDGYMEMVVRAHQSGALFEIGSLDVSFPYQPAQATLAYATSWSVVEYIEVTYGDAGIAALIEAFATGMPYDEALLSALGVDSDELDDHWKAWIASPST